MAVKELVGNDAQRRAAAKYGEAAARMDRALLEAIHQAQTQFILAEDPRDVFEPFLESLLSLTNSQYGFIDELFYDAEGQPYLTARAITDIAWSEESRTMYRQFVDGTLNFSNLKSLYGVVMATGQPVIANDAPRDPRRTGIPPGHPPLAAFLGLPLLSASQEFVGVIGLANRPGGYSEELIAHLDPMVVACANLIAARKNDQRRRQAEEELRLARDELELRVQERTAELQRAIAELARSNAELELFAAVASHDLQEPLRTMASYVELLAKRYQGKLDEKADRWIGFVVEGATRMKVLINELLEFSRVSTRGKSFDPTDCAAVFDAAVANLRTVIQESGAVVTHGPLPTVAADAAQLTQVLQNLIGNGLKFRSQKPLEIRVEAKREGKDWLFSVRDNGIGIDPQFAQRIFVIFQRLHTCEEYPGTGIGLALCKKIVERHGGRIWVESEPGQGSIFFFTLPVDRGTKP